MNKPFHLGEERLEWEQSKHTSIPLDVEWDLPTVDTRPPLVIFFAVAVMPGPGPGSFVCSGKQIAHGAKVQFVSFLPQSAFCYPCSHIDTKR